MTLTRQETDAPTHRRAAPATGEVSQETEVGSIFVSNYPPFSFWHRDQLVNVEAALASTPHKATDFGLYLHIPFCRKRCKFCYFRVYTDRNYDEIGGYLDALVREVELYAAQPAIAGRSPRFVYIGGGTPSYLSVAHLESLASRIQAAIPWEGAEEVTFECEPGTLQRAKLEAIREIGVTRLSLGIENFDDEILSLNGRAHQSKEIWRCLPWIEEVGFDQLNIDLIAGMVGESWQSWRETVAKTVDLAPDSVTIYQMEVPFNTRLAQGVKEGSLATPLADWETKRAWHDYAFEQLEKSGYETSSAYTVVRKASDCRFVYRDSVWHGCDMLGAGVASFSHLSGVHFQNVDGWGEYIAALGEDRLPLGRAFSTDQQERLIRELILQLKLGELGGGYFRHKFGVDIFSRFAPAFDRLARQGMVELGEDRVHLTRQGLLRADLLLPEFYQDQYRNARYT